MTGPTPEATRVAYLVNQYPKTSHSFIRTEILALERQGVAVDRIAVRGWDEAVVDPLDEAERGRTRYILKEGAPALLLATLRMALTRPRRFASALAAAWRLGRRADRPLPLHLVYLVEACCLVAWLEQAGIGHVHAHFGTNAAEVALLARHLGGPSYSFTVHGPEEFDKPLTLKLAEKIEGAAFVVAITSFCRSQLYRWIGQPDWHKVAVVRCGLDATFLDHPPSGRERTGDLLCIGRLCEQKGQFLLVEAMAILAGRGSRPTLTLVGDGELRDGLQARIDADGLADTVRIAGWQGGAAIRGLLDTARAMVLPSFAEGLPIVIMEAMAIGCPPITTTIAGIPELVRDGVDGVLVAPGDAAALADAIERFLALGEEAVAAMRRAGRERVRARHHVDLEAAKLAALFREATVAGG